LIGFIIVEIVIVYVLELLLFVCETVDVGCSRYRRRMAMKEGHG
jgi:hypothetical protein